MNVLPDIEMPPLQEEIDEPDDVIPEPVSEPQALKEPATMEEIFHDAPKIKQVKVRKKRPPMTEEHKLKLSEARVKALEVRRANAAEKKELKDLEKRAKQKKMNDLRASLGEPIKEVKVEKKVEMEIVRAQEQVRQTIRQTIQPRNITYGQEQYFENCF